MRVNGIETAGYAVTGYMAGKTKRSVTSGSMDFMETLTQKSDSVVERYKREHPEDASHVDAQVRAGKSVVAKNGVENISRKDMTMEEYKSFIHGLLNSIPFDSTRIFDREIVSISEDGWKQMKNNRDYEAWVLGYTVGNRSVRNPFFGWPGASANLCVERFGASIEEHIGQSVSTSPSGSKPANKKNEKSWWEKRHARMEELIAEQVEKSMAQRALEYKI